MSRESDYIDFLIQEYKTILLDKGFIEATKVSSSMGIFPYSENRSMDGRTYPKRFERDHQYVYLHTSMANQVVAWFWRDGKLWPDGKTFSVVKDYYFTGDKVPKLDFGMRGGTPELLRHFLSKLSEDWLVKEEK